MKILNETILPVEQIPDKLYDICTATALDGLQHLSSVLNNASESDKSRSITTELKIIDQCSHTCSSTEMKNTSIPNVDESKITRADNISIYNNMVNFGTTCDYNISNQIIMNQEITEKVMEVLDQSMQVFDGEGQLESLKDIGRIQVSFVFEGIFFFVCMYVTFAILQHLNNKLKTCVLCNICYFSSEPSLVFYTLHTHVFQILSILLFIFKLCSV